MTVLARSALEASPLADLHAIASELSIDGYRRLRRAALIDAILNKQEGGEPAETQPEAEETAEKTAEETPSAAPTRRRRASAARADDDAAPVAEAEDGAAAPTVEAEEDSGRAADADEEAPSGRRRRGRRGGRGRAAAREDDEATTSADEREAEAEPTAEADGSTSTSAQEELVEGVVELLANGSGFVRVDPPDPSDDDVYISSAQVKRCELVSGDRIAGPKRSPRRSERFASLIRIETINGRPASELADSVRFEDLPAAFPTEAFRFDGADPTLQAIGSLTPFGKGSRVTIVGPARAGKTEVIRRLAEALARQDGLNVSLVLSGVRPEEISDWSAGPVAPAASVSLAASEDARNSAIEPAIDQARRLAARGADAVVLIDSLDGASPSVARKALAAARNIVDGGSLTVVATASQPLGGETTVVALDPGRTARREFPAIELGASGTLRPELLVGEAGAEAIIQARTAVGAA